MCPKHPWKQVVSVLWRKILTNEPQQILPTQPWKKTLACPRTWDQTDTEPASRTLTPSRSFLKLLLMPFSSCRAGGGSTRRPVKHSPGAFASPSSSSLFLFQKCIFPLKSRVLGPCLVSDAPFRCVHDCRCLHMLACAVDPPTRTTGTSGRSFCSAADANQPPILPAAIGHDGLISSTSSA